MQSRTRPRVVLAGLPNAGKSTLFNRLTTSRSALVSAGEGTTRDFLQAPVEWTGLSFDLIDTAGWELPAEQIAEAAQQLRAAQVADADVVLWCSAANLAVDRRDFGDQLFAITSQKSRACFRVLTQTDRSDAQSWLAEERQAGLGDEVQVSQEITPAARGPAEISAFTGEGLDRMAELLRASLTNASDNSRQWLGATAARCRESLEAAAVALQQAEVAAGTESVGDELIAVDVRESLDHLGRILGVIYTDDILDRVFSKFCIGK
jgi:tRNA modification GTPase